MRRALFLTLVLFGIPAAALGQATASGSQTLQALLTEVRELRQDLRTSLARVQSGQILLARLQAQQAAVTHASEHLDDSRSKVADAQTHQQHLAAGVKQLEDALSAEENLLQRRELQDRLSHSKSELEDFTSIAQQLQAAEIEGEQRLRAEQDKFDALETQLDDLVKKLGNSSEQSGPARH
jgi:chromosome segregation ATPase